MLLTCALCSLVLVFLSPWAPALSWTPALLGRQISGEQWQSWGLSVVPTPGNTGASPPRPEFYFIATAMAEFLPWPL